MEITDNFNIDLLFFSKKVKIFIDSQPIEMQVPTTKKMVEDQDFILFYNLFHSFGEKIQKSMPIQIENRYDLLYQCMFNPIITLTREYHYLKDIMLKGLKFLFEEQLNIDYKNKLIYLKNSHYSQLIDNQIWEYVIYILEKANGLKTSVSPVFNSPEDEALYKAQQKAQEKINQIKSSNNNNCEDSLMKLFLSIMYSFPNFSIDYLYNQTMAQIFWLTKKAAGARIYDIECQTYAAGNMKKGDKPEFFIK